MNATVVASIQAGLGVTPLALFTAIAANRPPGRTVAVPFLVALLVVALSTIAVLRTLS